MSRLRCFLALGNLCLAKVFFSCPEASICVDLISAQSYTYLFAESDPEFLLFSLLGRFALKPGKALYVRLATMKWLPKLKMYRSPLFDTPSKMLRMEQRIKSLR